jgi:release factor glutamine methyltransferase
MPKIYEPREDTFLILKEVKRYAQGRVLDMGTGSGVLAIEASKAADSVIGADVNKKALDYARKKAANIDNIKFIHSDLFKKLKKQKFDLIIFNPPYLPEKKGEPGWLKLQITGGKKGYEILERFFSEASDYLAPDGKILVLFSTLTGADKVHEILGDFLFNYQKLAEESFDFEALFVYLVEKSDFLKELEKKGITNTKKIAKGRRGLIYKAKWKNKSIVIKKKRPESKAVGRMQNEADWLKVLNKKGIGPRFRFADRDYFAYDYVEGEFLPLFMEKSGKAGIKRVLSEIIKQCFILDKLRVNKEEMHRPLKHVLVDKNLKVVLIDFERTHKAGKPKNLTQFLQYLKRGQVIKILRKKGFKYNRNQLQRLEKKYKRDISARNVMEIIKALFLPE